MLRLGLLAVLAGLLAGAGPAAKPAAHEARWYHKLDRAQVQCDLCPRRCVIPEGKRGTCRVRENRGGTLYSIVYGKPCSVGREPIEKAPFFHFLPGRERITVATVGCNQSCRYCQNWQISQAQFEDVPNRNLSPAELVNLAVTQHVPILCFTYSEPIVFYEYMADAARLAREKGIRTAVVTGGFVNPEPLAELCGLVDAIKIDLKGFSETFYKDVCGSSLGPVLAACRTVAQSGTHLELVNLVVPGLNDDSAGIAAMCRWVVENCGDSVPVHFTRFGPNYKLQNTPATPVATLETAARVGKASGLQYVYLGNVPGHRLESTTCPECGRVIVERQGYTVTANEVKDGKCRFCGARISGVWN
jgi:pyruvate formate lyase activating enzyme